MKPPKMKRTKFTKAQFAEACRVKVQTIDTYISRGKLELKNGKIDTEEEANRSFFLEHTSPDRSLSRQIREAELLKKTREGTLLSLKIDKQRGELVPTEIVRLTIIQHTKSIISAHHQAADNIITEIAHRAKLTSKDVATLRTRLISVINKAGETAVAESKKGLDNIVKEYSETRGRGERK